MRRHDRATRFLLKLVALYDCKELLTNNNPERKYMSLWNYFVRESQVYAFNVFLFFILENISHVFGHIIFKQRLNKNWIPITYGIRFLFFSFFSFLNFVSPLVFVCFNLCSFSEWQMATKQAFGKKGVKKEWPVFSL